MREQGLQFLGTGCYCGAAKWALLNRKPLILFGWKKWDASLCLCIHVSAGHDDIGLSPRVRGTVRHVFDDRYTVLFCHSNKGKKKPTENSL